MPLSVILPAISQEEKHSLTFAKKKENKKETEYSPSNMSCTVIPQGTPTVLAMAVIPLGTPYSIRVEVMYCCWSQTEKKKNRFFSYSTLPKKLQSAPCCRF